MRFGWLGLALALTACSGDGEKAGDDDDDVTVGDDDDDDTSGDDDDDDTAGDDDDDDLPPASDLAAEYERARRLKYAGCTQTTDSSYSLTVVYDADGWIIKETLNVDGNLRTDANTIYTRVDGKATDSVRTFLDYEAVTDGDCTVGMASETRHTTYDEGERQLSWDIARLDGCGYETTEAWTFEYDLVGGLLTEGRAIRDGLTDVITYDDCGLYTSYEDASGTVTTVVNTYAEDCIPAQVAFVGVGTMFYEDGRVARFEIPIGDDVIVTNYSYECN